MSINLLATFYSFAYILIIVGIAFLLYRYTGIGSEGVRKFIHILVSGWVFILVGMYDSLPWALLGPSVFIVINAVFVYSGFSKYLGMGNRKRDNGLIYYPFSILVLIILLYKGVIDERVVVALFGREEEHRGYFDHVCRLHYDIVADLSRQALVCPSFRGFSRHSPGKPDPSGF